MKKWPLAPSAAESLVIRYAIPVIWLGPALLFLASTLAHPPKNPLVDRVILFMSAALSVAAISLRVALGMMPSSIDWIQEHWFAAGPEATRIASEHLAALSRRRRFGVYGIGFVVAVGFFAAAFTKRPLSLVPIDIARWLLCPLLWGAPIVVGFWSLVQMARTVRRALMSSSAHPKLVITHPDGCGGTSVVGRMVIAVASPLLVGTIALATVLFVPTEKDLHPVVRVAAAAVGILIVLPSLWVVLIEPLLAAQQRVAIALANRLSEARSRAEAIEARYDELIAEAKWEEAKTIIEAGATARTRRDALASMRTLPISTALLAQVTATQVASMVVVFARILTGE